MQPINSRADLREIRTPHVAYSIADITQGLDAGEFRLALEPQVDLESGELLGFECLARWRHPRDGIVMPAQFIPLLEQHDMTGRLALALLERVFSVRQRLRTLGARHDLSLNISAKSLSDSSFVPAITRIADAAHDSFVGITLEVTESSDISNETLSSQSIEALKALGLRLSLDDFWTGYSSLSKPNLDAFAEVKIDYQLTRHIGDDRVALAGVSSIQTFATMLGWRCVVEGVESHETVKLLRAIGCKTGQGYFFSRPIDEDTIEKWIADKVPFGYFDDLSQKKPSGSFALPLADEVQLAVHQKSSIPIWLFNIDQSRMEWANHAALKLWMADSLSEFTGRNFKSDMSAVIQNRLSSLKNILRDGGTIAEQWTIYPHGRPKSVYSVMKGCISLSSDFLLEIHGYTGIGPGNVLASAETSIEYSPNPLLKVHKDGRIRWKNAASVNSFTEIKNNFIDAVESVQQARDFVGAVFNDGAAEANLRIRNRNCMIPCRVKGVRIKDPDSGVNLALLTVIQICDLMGCSHKSLR